MQARAGQADLSCVVVLPGGLLRRRVDVGVVEDDERVLAAELGREGDEVASGRDADVAGGLG